MSYFDYYYNNTRNNEAESSGVIKGTCHTMCPQEEVLMREQEKLVHVLEVRGPDRILIKAYSRSAADSNIALPHLLRPFRVLRGTVQYLLLDVTKRLDVSKVVVYDFVNDRLRAVRQDMTVQRLPAHECVALLEPMVRFYVYFGYILCEHPLNTYDPVLNQKNLLECLKWFLSCCDSMDRSRGDSTLDELTRSLGSVQITSGTVKLSCDRVLVESLYILCNLDDFHPLIRYLNLPKHLKCTKTLGLAYNIAIANMKGNYVKVCNQFERLCPLARCALCLYLPVLQRRALAVASRAYSSRQLLVPVAALCAWLLLDTDHHALHVCARYGLRPHAHGHDVQFAAADFRTDVAAHTPRLHRLLPASSLNIDTIFSYNAMV